MKPTVYTQFAKDRHGWFFGLTGPQLAAAVVGGLPELAAINAHDWTLVLGWLPIWALLVGLIVVPVAGRPAARWLADLTVFAVGDLFGWTGWQSRTAAGLAVGEGEADLPGVLAGVRVHDGPPYGHSQARPAIVQDTASRTWAAVARIVHPGIGLAELGDRTRMAAGLTELCEVASRTGLVDLIAIQVRTIPDDGAERAAWLAGHRGPGAPPLARQINDVLMATLTPAAVRTEAFVTVVVPEARIARPAREYGGGLEGRARAVYGVMGEVEQRLRGAIGCTEVTWLGTTGLAAAIRTSFAPGDRAVLIAADHAAGTDPNVATGVPLPAAGPTRAATHARYYVHDAWASITDTILLPDQGAVFGALAPVLVPAAVGERRSLTVFYPALARSAGDRAVGRAEMSAATGNALRDRAGLLTRARQRRATARVADMDDKLARGHALVRPSAAAAVTVPAGWPIAEQASRLDTSIRAAGFIPQRLDLAHDSGFAAACVPLGIGLPRRRGRR